eukprot:437215-Prymnesium_polylepis.1
MPPYPTPLLSQILVDCCLHIAACASIERRRVLMGCVNSTPAGDKGGGEKYPGAVSTDGVTLMDGKESAADKGENSENSTF